jgi:hypothetical protein
VPTSSLIINRWSAAMPQPNDLSRSLVALDHNSTIIAVVEMSQSTWLVGGVVPGIERQPRKKLEPRPERPCLAASLARRGGQGRPHNHTDCAGLRSRSRRLLAGALAGGARSRGVRDAPLKCRGVARTSPSQDRPARHRVAETGFSGWLRGERAIAAWCAYRRLPKRTPSGPIGSASAWSRNAHGL